MKKVIIGFIVVFIIIIIAFTNPNEYNYKLAVKDYYNSNLIIEIDTFYNDYERNGHELGVSYAKMIAENQINSNVNRDNYLLFSVGKWRDNYIGYGFCGNVFLTNEFKEKLDNIGK